MRVMLYALQLMALAPRGVVKKGIWVLLKSLHFFYFNKDL